MAYQEPRGKPNLIPNAAKTTKANSISRDSSGRYLRERRALLFDVQSEPWRISPVPDVESLWLVHHENTWSVTSLYTGNWVAGPGRTSDTATKRRRTLDHCISLLEMQQTSADVSSLS